MSRANNVDDVPWGRIFMMIRVLWAFVFLLVAVYGAARPGFAADPVGNYTHPLSIVTTDGVRHDFMVEIVRTQATRKMGLMYRTEMPESAGMLFIFPESDERAFWMKKNLIPLDMGGWYHHPYS